MTINDTRPKIIKASMVDCPYCYSSDSIYSDLCVCGGTGELFDLELFKELKQKQEVIRVAYNAN